MVLGTDDDDIAHATAQAALPPAIQTTFLGVNHTLRFQNYDFEYLGGSSFSVIGHYAKPEPQGQDDGNGPQSEYAFDTTGGTQRITHGLTISKTTFSGGTVQENHGGINVTENGAEGVDWPVPRFAWTETHYLDDLVVTDAYKAVLRDMTGRVNNGTWRNNAAGEVRFMGARGSKRSGEQWQIAFSFEAEKNATGIVISAGTAHEITVPAKQGFHYLWLRTAKVEDGTGKCLAPAPTTAYVSQVLPDELFYGDFDTIIPG